MSRSAARARAGRGRTSLYQEITDKIIAEQEAGRVPWVQPWATLAAFERGFGTQNWLTFRQALGLGANVRKGEHGTTIVYADRLTPDEERRRAERDGDEPITIPFLKRFTVFNTDQCENLPRELTTAPAPVPEGVILPQAEALIVATGADFRIGGDRAFYSPNHDFIQVPRPDAYFEPINWHRTALHELGHWSGATHRLGRDLSGIFGSKKYAHEELIAEIASAFVCASLGILPTVRHADYIGSWLEVLREDDRAIVRALRTDACKEEVSLVRQIVDGVGAGFRAVIVFDESDAMQNAAGEKSERGDSSNLNAAVQAANVTDKAAA